MAAGVDLPPTQLASPPLPATPMSGTGDQTARHSGAKGRV